MLTVKTYVTTSKLHGNGVYADENIPKGKIIWEYFPLIDITYTESEWESLKKSVAPESFKNLQNYSYKENKEYIICMDNAQFMNHDEKNFNVIDTEDLKSMYASRDIKKGEELLCNYFGYSDKDDHHVKSLKIK